MTQSELVSVVIPAHNAEATLGRTLASVREQTYQNLEIVVVNDGSTDGTRALAEAEARADPRIHVLSQPNGGLAEARNAGVRASRGALVAPVDADDIWHPEKIARQVAVLAEGGPAMGFVFTYYRRIDMADNALPERQYPCDFSGHVFLRHLLFNFVGNGSSMLMRRAAFDSVGGYEPDLQRQDAQGCEDYLLQLLIARAWTVGLVPEYLTGYRAVPGAMSTNRDRMNRSLLLMLGHVRARVPEIPRDVLAVAEAALRSRRAMGMLLQERRPMTAATQFLHAFGRGPAAATAMGGWLLRQTAARVVRRQLPLSLRRPRGESYPFLALEPATAMAPARDHPLDRWLVAFGKREDAFFHDRPAGSGRRDRGSHAQKARLAPDAGPQPSGGRR